MSLSKKVFIALGLGFIFGLIIHPINKVHIVDKYLINFFLDFIGQLFLNAIKMMVVPLVFISLVWGSASVGDTKKLGRIGLRTMLFYLTTTAIAISIAILLSNIISPGAGMEMTSVNKTTFNTEKSQTLMQVILGIVPTNPIESFVKGNMLQIIFFALLVGITLTKLGKKADKVTKLFKQLNEVVLKMVDIIMEITPYGVFALISKTFATIGYSAMLPLIKYMLTIIVALLLHYAITYQSMIVLFTSLNPFKFLKKFISAISVAFSTASSSATLPVTIETAEKKLGISNSIASFALPLGATINMDGTAIMQGVATVFIAQVYSVPMSITAYISVIITATLASIGTAGVPGVGIIMLSMVLKQAGLPVEGIALVIGVDRLLDMMRTAVNITGDATCALIVAHKEGELNREIFNSQD